MGLIRKEKGSNSMRVIAGKARRLPLKTIEGLDTRPTTDRIKETLFNMIQQDVPDCYFLDLFAGSGQIGLEAVSRGAAKAFFIENAKNAAACIQDNIRFTKFEDACTLLQTDVISGLRTLEGKYRFDLIFMDPPYKKELEKEVLTFLSHSSLVKPSAKIIVEAALETDFSYAEGLGYTVLKEKCYKTNKHVFLQKEK